ncbi:30S ribosomal protein S16 [Myxococcota bacterium]|nr:30S ribosomal protein S16 [Myxococcota bacterium]MBU1432803.1 30S ribosomal protein S16 [Myxococcota bacterium]MBU1897292.1 30S ribosomal protein S16 [Myxococcota bacterium]
MAVHIRLQRFGAKKRPYYRVVAANARAKRDGRFLEQIGTYDPMANPAQLSFKSERVEYWLSVGAQPSATVASLLRKFNKQNETK